MRDISIDQAGAIVDATLRSGRESKLGALTVAVVDMGGNLKAFKREDGPGGAVRSKIATGKAVSAVGMGRSTRAIAQIAEDRPGFFASLVALTEGQLVPAAGGVLISDEKGQIIGAVGVTGDTSDNDEVAAVAGIEAAGLRAVQ